MMLMLMMRLMKRVKRMRLELFGIEMTTKQKRRKNQASVTMPMKIQSN